MRRALLVGLVALAATAGAAAKLPRGDGLFRLGMEREQLEAAVRGAGVEVISDEPGFLVSAGSDPGVEYEQYAFYALPHGDYVLWRVTRAYRLGATPADFAALDSTLRASLGAAPDTAETPESAGPAPERRLRWTDGRTMVLLAARWPEEPRTSDRMILEWSDLKLRKAVASASRPSR